MQKLNESHPTELRVLSSVRVRDGKGTKAWRRENCGRGVNSCRGGWDRPCSRDAGSPRGRAKDAGYLWTPKSVGLTFQMLQSLCYTRVCMCVCVFITSLCNLPRGQLYVCPPGRRTIGDRGTQLVAMDF